MSTVFGPQSVAIPKGSWTSPAESVPAGVDAITITLSRENWPAGGLDMQIQMSFDGGATWQGPGWTHIDPFVPDAKNPDVLQNPASIGLGWNEQLQQPTHVRAMTENAPARFNSTVQIDTSP